jgi:hypothetical protein
MNENVRRENSEAIYERRVSASARGAVRALECGRYVLTCLGSTSVGGFCTRALSKPTNNAPCERTAGSAGAYSKCVSSSTPTPATAYRQRAREQRPDVAGQVQREERETDRGRASLEIQLDRESGDRAETVKKAAANT